MSVKETINKEVAENSAAEAYRYFNAFKRMATNKDFPKKGILRAMEIALFAPFIDKSYQIINKKEPVLASAFQKILDHWTIIRAYDITEKRKQEQLTEEKKDEQGKIEENRDDTQE